MDLWPMACNYFSLCMIDFRGQFYQLDYPGNINNSWEGVRVQGLAYRWEPHVLGAILRCEHVCPSLTNYSAAVFVPYKIKKRLQNFPFVINNASLSLSLTVSFHGCNFFT